MQGSGELGLSFDPPFPPDIDTREALPTAKATLHFYSIDRSCFGSTQSRAKLASSSGEQNVFRTQDLGHRACALPGIAFFITKELTQAKLM
jgi:hypothetical protein